MPIGFGEETVAFSPGGHTVAIGTVAGGVDLYDITTSTRTAQLSSAQGSTQDVDFSPDGSLLASVSLNGVATIWDVAKRRRVASLAGAIAAFAVAFSPDGRLVAVGDSSGRVVLWDVARGTPVGQPLVGHGGAITSVDFDASGGRLVTASADGQLRLWDVATKRLIGAPLPGSSGGGWVHFFPDGKHVLGVFGSGVGIVWNVDPAAWEAKACSIARRNLSRAEWIQVLGTRSYQNVCP